MGLRSLRAGENPREALSNHNERGPERMTYTRQDLAQLYGVSIHTLYHWVSDGKLDPHSLDSVCRLWHQRAKP
jgi:transposase